MESHHRENNCIYNVQVQIVTDDFKIKWVGSIPVEAESVNIAKMLAARAAKNKDEYMYGDKVEILFIYK